jgi:hypothetical protein
MLRCCRRLGKTCSVLTKIANFIHEHERLVISDFYHQFPYLAQHVNVIALVSSVTDRFVQACVINIDLGFTDV